MPAVQNLHDILPTLLVVARSRDVGVSQLVDQRQFRVPFEDGVEIHLLEVRSPVVDGLPWDNLKVTDQVFGEVSAVTLDEGDDDVGAPPLTSVALIEHGVGLPDAGGGAEVDAEVPGRLDALGVLGGDGRHGVHCCTASSALSSAVLQLHVKVVRTISLR